ncbi:MAG: excinuclease ABC subunit A [Anaerolineaceae bacterium 4572_32.2]|nr:MAG: excinuclease ABC subunit A [Anaerolineaceae bacterium 4572_32.2]HEY72742.1 excinuclease ABC subunit UvrA [Thermoflexia bacterium]
MWVITKRQALCPTLRNVLKCLFARRSPLRREALAQDKIIVRGAREHNLKNITVEIPRNKMVVVTGISGSGKSSLAFDTIYAEGQRRYVESLSAYARQFLGQMEKPDVDQIEGLSPAISIDQRGASHNPRSTVGTVTEIYDYLRLLYARIGVVHCPQCGREVTKQSAQQIVDTLMGMKPAAHFQVLAPLIKERKGHHQAIFEDVRKAGFVRARVDGAVRDVDEEIELDRYKMHTIEAVVDRLIIPEAPEKASGFRSRLTDSVETALRLGDGVVLINDLSSDPPQDVLYSERLACPNCAISLPEIEPRTFSFNRPQGACPKCQGLGVRLELDPDLIVPNPDQSIEEGAISAWNIQDREGYYWQLLKAACDHFGIPTDAPWRELNQAQQRIILHGSGEERMRVRYVNRDGRHNSYLARFEGAVANLQRRYQETSSDYVRSKIEEFMTRRPCPDCRGARLRPEALAVLVAHKPISEIAAWPVSGLLAWIDTLSLSEKDQMIARRILKEVRDRLRFLVNVGLDYLTLDRTAATLAGGEAQRIRLATQIGSQLMGVLYVLDEPSIGLHQRDNARLIRTLQEMRDLGNTLIVVEHDEATIQAADWLVDLGPGAGERGGEVIVAGAVKDLIACPESVTGAYLSGRRTIPMPAQRREGNGGQLMIRGAREHNLKEIDVRIPLGKLVCITGVSGSGKSTLLVEVLYRRLAQILHNSREPAGDHDAVEGAEQIDKVINIDQSPIGRTPRSNPATYTKLFTPIRELFAALPESKIRGYKPGRFSFNVKGGRCEACQGHGTLRIEMQFLPDIYVPCDVCHGRRYNRETLQVRYGRQHTAGSKTIAEVLDLTVTEAVEFFANIPKIQNKLQTLQEVGLGYIRLGQPAPTLSGGEAQRIKLSRELSKRATGQTLYVLDEPSVGLHAADVDKLVAVLNRLVDAGNTVVIIEHHPGIIKVADWIIDLGPEGGDEGGKIVAEGTPEQVAQVESSYTGQFLKQVLSQQSA